MTTLSEAATDYLEGLAPEARGEAHAEVQRFVRWCGPDRAMSDVSGHDVSTYVEGAGGAVGAASRLDQLKSFLAFAKKAGLTSANLAAHARLRKQPAGASKRRAAVSPRPSVELVHLTAEGHAALVQELEKLRDERPRVAQELRHAMADKDFRENAPLDAMRDHQAMIEGRIREIEGALRHAVVGGAPGDHSRAHIGSTVVLTNLSTGREMRYMLVSPSEVNAAEGRISVASPVGKALLDGRAGDEVEVAAPAGTLRLRIERVEA